MTGGPEQADQQQHTDEQNRIDARYVDLSCLRCGGVQDRDPRQHAELDRLPDQRIGTGDDGLAGNHGGRGRQHDGGE